MLRSRRRRRLSGPAVHRAALAVADAFERAEADVHRIGQQSGRRRPWHQHGAGRRRNSRTAGRSLAGTRKARLPQWLRRCAGRSPEAQGRSTRRGIAAGFARAWIAAFDCGKLGRGRFRGPLPASASWPSQSAATEPCWMRWNRRVMLSPLRCAKALPWMLPGHARLPRPKRERPPRPRCIRVSVVRRIRAAERSERRMPARWPCWCGCARLERLYADKSLVRPTVK